MEDEIVGVVPQDGTITETEGAPPQPEDTQPTTVGIEEYQKLQSELENIKKAQAGSDRMVTQLKREKELAGSNKQAAADTEFLNKKLDLLLRHQSGQFDETSGSIQQQLDQLAGEYTQKKQALEAVGQYSSHAHEALDSIREIFEVAGINPDDESVLEVKEMQALYNQAVQKGERLDGVIAKAAKTVASKVRSAQPDEAEIEKRIRQKIHEEEKKSPGLRVDTGAPMSPSEKSSEQRLKERYPTMDK